MAKKKDGPFKDNPKYKSKQWTDKQLETAESMYMDYLPITEIAKESGVPRTTLYYYIRSSWKLRREVRSKELLSAIAVGKREAFEELTGSALKIMSRALTALVQRPQSPTMKEAIDASKVISEIDRITRLDKAENNEPTDELDINEVLSNDPFLTKGKKDEKNSKLN